MKLYNIDSTKLMKKMIENKITVDAIITDSPYLISKKSGYTNTKVKKYKNHTIDFGEWDKKELDLETIFNLYFKLLKDGGTILFFYDCWKMQEVKEVAEAVGFKQARLCQWVKTNPVPINSKLNYLSNVKEYFITFVKKSKPTFNSKYDNGLYSYPICHGKERTKHPTQKPLKLMEDLVLKHTNEGDLILDPFMGSGTTGEAALKNNRKFIGAELIKEYFDLASDRLNEYKDV